VIIGVLRRGLRGELDGVVKKRERIEIKIAPRMGTMRGVDGKRGGGGKQRNEYLGGIVWDEGKRKYQNEVDGGGTNIKKLFWNNFYRSQATEDIAVMESRGVGRVHQGMALPCDVYSATARIKDLGMNERPGAVDIQSWVEDWKKK
jgi:hypothetical protein